MKSAPPSSGVETDVDVAPETRVSPAPDAARGVFFVLNEVRIEGGTIFTDAQLRGLWETYRGKKISLDLIWAMADQLTAAYRQAGYFLSRAYVPQQKIADGVVVLKVLEGYIGKVSLDDAVSDYRVIKGLIADLTRQRPARAQDVESLLLRLNDLPGLSFRAVLTRMPPGEEQDGATMLVLQPGKKPWAGSMTFDNNGSRFLGPNQTSLVYQAALLPLQMTQVSASTSLPTDELNQVSFEHVVTLLPQLKLGVTGGITQAAPGFTLKPLEVESTSTSAGLSLQYTPVRQRTRNVSVRAALDKRDIASDIAGTALTRDHIRALRLAVSCDGLDPWGGYSSGTVTFSRGLSILNASSDADLNLSRTGASSDFTKLEASFSRQDLFMKNWLLQSSFAGQIAPDALFSSEEFGYGGTAFGRAYDSSEITARNGAAGSVEIQYAKFSGAQPIGVTPYAFYDIGVVWDDNTKRSGSSAGFGQKFRIDRVSGNLGVAFPLTRPIATPVYGGDPNGLRVLLQISSVF